MDVRQTVVGYFLLLFAGGPAGSVAVWDCYILPLNGYQSPICLA